MDCYEALEILEADAIGAWPLEQPRLDAARQHLASCTHCQRAWPQRAAFGRQLLLHMPAVEVPADLAARLHAQLAPRVADPPQRPVRRRLALMIGIAASLVAVCAWVAVALRSELPASLQTLQAAVDVSLEELPPFSGPFTPRLPTEWEPFFDLAPHMVHGFPAAAQFSGSNGPRQVGKLALVPFQFTLRRGTEPLQGRLLILLRTQLEPDQVPRESFASAEILYLPQQRGAWIVWSEGEYVFACLMPSSSAPAALQQFRRALSVSRPLS
jgi:hypothetical protein